MSDADESPSCACPFERPQPPGWGRILLALLALALFLAGLTWLGR